MKIAFISGAFFPTAGGAQVQNHNIANKLVEKGIDIELFIFNKTNIKNNKYNITIFNKFLLNTVYFFKYFFNLDFSFLLKSYIFSLIKKFKFDIWHFSFLNFKSLILINILKKYDQKIIVSFHGADIQIDRSINYGYRISKKYDVFLKNTLNKIDKFTYISETIKNDVLELGVNEKKLEYFPNSINLDKFKDCKENANVDETILRLITVARFAEKKKGLDLVEKISQMMLKKNINFRWKIIGENSKLLLKNSFINTNKDYFDIVDNIQNKDEEYFPHSNLIKHYKSSDLYINLSRIESFGVTYIESIAAKVPIISFNSKGTNEIVKDNVNGFLIDKDDILNFVNKIFQINENKNIIYNLKDKCINSILEFDLEKTSSRLINIYKKLN